MRLSVALSVLLASTPVLGAPIVVDSTSGANNVPGSCTLRDAITSANTDSAVGGCAAGSGSDTISLPAGATITLTDLDNSAGGPNGLPAIDSTVVIEGNGATIARDTSVACSNLFEVALPYTFRFFYTTPGAVLTLHHLVLTEGCAPGDFENSFSGGSIYNAGQLSLQDVLIRNSRSASLGGAIFNDGNLVVDRTTFDSNSTYGFGGAIADSGNGHDTLVTHSLFRANTTVGSPNRGEGGAIYHDTGTLTLRNDTFAQNIAYHGGALRLNTGASLISNVTLSGNSAIAIENDGGISSAAVGASVAKITNSIVTDSGVNCATTAGYLGAVGANLSGDASCTGFTLSSTNAQLSSLSAGGDSPGYFSLPATSPAVDAALSCLDASGTITIADDQRGRPRPYGTNCDLGAYERDDFIFANGFEP